MKARAIQEVMNNLDIILSESSAHPADGSLAEYKKKLSRICDSAFKIQFSIQSCVEEIFK